MIFPIVYSRVKRVFGITKRNVKSLDDVVLSLECHPLKLAKNPTDIQPQ